MPALRTLFAASMVAVCSAASGGFLGPKKDAQFTEHSYGSNMSDGNRSGEQDAMKGEQEELETRSELENNSMRDLLQTNGHWKLNKDSPDCPSSQVPARESASHRAAGDRGWDPCCADSKCNILDAVWDSGAKDGVPLGKPGKWCSKHDFEKNGNKCKEHNWNHGFMYDHCPCDKSEANCKHNKRQMCIPDALIRGHYSGGWKDHNKMKEQCKHGRTVCYGGMILAPNSDGSCSDKAHDRHHDSNHKAMCVPGKGYR